MVAQVRRAAQLLVAAAESKVWDKRRMPTCSSEAAVVRCVVVTESAGRTEAQPAWAKGMKMKADRRQTDRRLPDTQNMHSQLETARPQPNDKPDKIAIQTKMDGQGRQTDRQTD